MTYEQCCARWHDGPLRLQAPDAESLMRSRYSAFVLGLGDYEPKSFTRKKPTLREPLHSLDMHDSGDDGW